VIDAFTIRLSFASSTRRTSSSDSSRSTSCVIFDRTQLSLLANSLSDNGSPAATKALRTEYFGVDRPGVLEGGFNAILEGVGGMEQREDRRVRGLSSSIIHS
jgi:hypothetical protein